MIRSVAVMGSIAGALLLLKPAAVADDGCRLTPGGVECRVSGTTTSIVSGSNPVPVLPDRYLRVHQGSCWYWGRYPPGIDSWSLLNDSRVIRIVAGLPECRWDAAPSTTTPTSEIVSRAWEIFRSLPLPPPAFAIEPPGSGITGLPSYAWGSMPPTVRHSESLPDGSPLEVIAEVAEIRIDWGDGTPRLALRPSEFVPRPYGRARHVYLLKTCTAEYRAEHPSGPNCHPYLRAYPVEVEFVWQARYRRGAGWIDLGSLGRARTVLYEVDEVLGVLG